MQAAVVSDRSDRACRIAIVQALEAIEAGDYRLAVDLLLNALEEPSGEPPVCATCGVRAWPGDLRRHVWSLHRAAEEALDCAA